MPTTPRRQAEEFSDTTGAELSAVRNLFGAIEAGIRATAPAATRAGLLATLRNQLDAMTREIIERGQRRRQHHHELQRAALEACSKLVNRLSRRSIHKLRTNSPTNYRN